MIAPPSPGTGRATRRAPFFAAVLALLVIGHLTNPATAHAQSDAVPTWWHEAAGLTPLLTAPPPPNPATICLIDTGVTPTPDLDITARWAYDGGTLDDVRATEDSPGHGTLVAHFAAGAVNGWGGAGAFPHARISSVRVFPREGGASWREYIAAISRCSKLDPNTKVIVISIGGQEIGVREAEELEHYVEQARDLYDDNVVVAAGNGAGRPDFPGRFDDSFTVTAIGGDGLCPFSADGPEVDLLAPGCGLQQAPASGEVWTLDGTSFAAPIVAGSLAAVRSYAPSLTAAEAESLLVATARGERRILDVGSALRAAGIGGDWSDSLAAEPPGRPSLSAALPEATTSGSRRPAVMPRPQIIARRLGGQVLIVARNRPRGATLDVRVGWRRVTRRRSRLRLTSARATARCRFVRGSIASVWTTVRW